MAQSSELRELFDPDGALFLARTVGVTTLDELLRVSERQLRTEAMNLRYPRGEQLVDRVIRRLNAKGLSLAADRPKKPE